MCQFLDDYFTLSIFRLTLVTGFNLSDAEGYADLVRIANPDFIEVKGVTYCGTSNNAELSMKNVPWHEQVIEFCANLQSSAERSDGPRDFSHTFSQAHSLIHKTLSL